MPIFKQPAKHQNGHKCPACKCELRVAGETNPIVPEYSLYCPRCFVIYVVDYEKMIVIPLPPV